MIASGSSLPDTHGGRPVIFSNEQYFLVFQMQNLIRIMLDISVDDVLHVTICYILNMNKNNLMHWHFVWFQEEDILLRKLFKKSTHEESSRTFFC